MTLRREFAVWFLVLVWALLGVFLSYKSVYLYAIVTFFWALLGLAYLEHLRIMRKLTLEEERKLKE